MSGPKLTRRNFLKLSAGVAAGAALTRYAPAARAQGSKSLRLAMWDGPEVKPQIDQILTGFKDKFGADVAVEFDTSDYDTKIVAGLARGDCARRIPMLELSRLYRA